VTKALVIAKLVEAGHVDLADQLVEVVQGGTVAYPPHMYELIRTWVLRVYGSWVAQRAERMARRFILSRDSLVNFRDDSINDDFGGDIKKYEAKIAEYNWTMDEYRKVVAAATKLTGNKLLTKMAKRPTKTVKVDLRGLNPKNYPIDRMTQLTDKFPVVMNMESKNRTTKAYWTSTPAVKRKIVFFLSEDLLDVKKAWALDYNVAKLEESLVHELQHMVQSLILDTIEEPEKHIKNRRRDFKKVPAKYRYWLDPAEFDTWIRSSKQTFLGEVMVTRPEWEDKSITPNIRSVRPNRKEFDDFVGNPKPVASKTGVSTSTFFKALFTYDKPRYKRAVS
jgi:hypothetical protein